MIDQVLKEIGIEGGNLAKMGGLMREASDMQRVAKEVAPREGGAGGGKGKPETKGPDGKDGGKGSGSGGGSSGGSGPAEKA
jgi:hypothetical protein